MWGEKSPKSLKIRAVEVKIYLRPGFLPYFWWNISTIWPFVDKNPFWRCQMMGQSCFECFQKRKGIFSSKRRCWVGFFVIFSHFWVIGQFTVRGICSSWLVLGSRSGSGCIMAYCTKPFSIIGHLFIASDNHCICDIVNLQSVWWPKHDSALTRRVRFRTSMVD